MKTLLISAPGCYVDVPPLGPACLQAYLKAQGISDVSVWDSNIAYVEYLLDQDTLVKQEKRIRDGLASRGSEELRSSVLFTLPYIQESISDAVDTFRNKDRYYDVPSFNRAISLVQSALNAYSTEPGRFDYSIGSNGFYFEVDKTKPAFDLVDRLEFARSQTSYHPLKTFFELKVPWLQEKGPYDLVGFSVSNSLQFYPTLILALLFKQAGLAKKIALGGSYLSAFRKVICSRPETYDFFDYIVPHEGEISLLKLVESISEDGELDEVPNLFYRKGGLIQNNPPVAIEDLNTLPTPDFTDYPLGHYLTPEPVLPIYCTRGCYYGVCSFCNHHENYFGGFRTRTTENVINDIKIFQEKYGATKLMFVDELMIPQQQVKIAERIAGEKLPTKWYSHTRVEKYLTKERLDKLAAGGLILLHVGMESANSNVLKLMKKGYKRDRVVRLLSDLHESSVTAHINTIRNFPGEQPDEYLETLRTVWEYAKSGDKVHLYDFMMISESPVAIEGNSFIESVTAPPYDLGASLEYKTNHVRPPTPDEERETNQLINLLDHHSKNINSLFPKSTIWVEHLLYVAHYRATNRASLVDTPRSEVRIQAEHLRAFAEDGDLGAWSMKVLGRVVLKELPVNNKLQWFALDLESFSLIPISKPIVRLLKENSGKTLKISKWANNVGVDVDDFRLELYQLTREGIIQLKAPSQKEEKTRPLRRKTA